MSRTSPQHRLTFLTEFAEDVPTPDGAAVPAAGSDEELVIPEDLSGVPDADLAGLHTGAVEAFTALYGEDGQGLSEEQLGALSVLTEGIERVQTELDARKGKDAERQDAAGALAARAGIKPAAAPAELATGGEQPETDKAVAGTIVEEGPKEVRINLAGLRRQTAAVVPVNDGPVSDTAIPRPAQMQDIVKASPQFAGFADGQGLSWEDIAKGLDRRLTNFNASAYQSAASQGKHLRSQLGMITIQKPFDDKRLVLDSLDPRKAMSVMDFAADESRLKGNSLVAAGGWCAPSETIYDLMEVESRDGLYDLPTIGITRGGINHTTGPSFGDLFAAIKGFSYTEADDLAGDYAVDANGVGTGAAGNKPCYHIDCPDFSEDRLGFDGLCLTAGLLQQRGYPEVIARTTRGALVVHDHLMAGRVLAKVIAGSTAVSMPANQVGATAPILTAIELQVEHYRYTHRLLRSTSLEAVFPFWVHGAIRSDLSRRLGIDLLDVSDARIDGWFADRGIAPQFIYNFDDLTGAAGSFVAWPTTVRFVLYAAGTWVRGSSDIITLDTVYDSTLLGQNDYTALFTEEGWLVAKRGFDSRVVSVNICPDGATHGGVSIACDGSQSGTAQV